MASDAGRLVEDGPETVCHILFLHERRPALLEERKLFGAEPGKWSAECAADELGARRAVRHLRRFLRRRLRGAGGEENHTCGYDHSSGHWFLPI